MYITPKNTEPALITRYLHSATMFGPILFVIGGRSSHSNNASFDVYLILGMVLILLDYLDLLYGYILMILNLKILNYFNLFMVYFIVSIMSIILK